MQETLFINQLFTDIKKKIKPHWITAFISGMVIGFITYGYFMANNFLVYDSMWNIYSDQNMIMLGRQFLQFACGISSYYDLSWTNGLLSIIYLSITSILVIEGLNIKSHINSALTAGILVAFPNVIATFCLTFTVDGYMLATLLAAAAFLITYRKKWGFLPGIVLMGISLGIYQAYLAFVIVLCIIRLLLDILEKNTFRDIFTKAVRFVLMGAGSYAFYVLTLNLMLKLQSIELSAYQGMDKLQNFSFSDLPAGFQAAWNNFYHFARWGNVLTTTTPMTISYLALALLGVLCYVYFFVKAKCHKKPWCIPVTLVLLAVLPFGTTVCSIISPDVFHNALLHCAWSVYFIFVLALSERLAPTEHILYNRLKSGAVVAVTLFTAILIFQFTVVANIAAFNLNERYEKSYSLCLRILDRLEQTPGYEHGMPVSILGGEPAAPTYPSTDITANDLSGYCSANGDYVVNGTEKFASFMSHYMQVTLTTIDYADELKLCETVEYQNAPAFPDEGCITLIDGIWVVKLN